MNRHLMIVSMLAAAIAAGVAAQAGEADAPATTLRPLAATTGPLSLDLAYRAAKAALRACEERGFPNAAAAVADTNAVVLVILRAPVAPAPTIESARRKAYTAVKTGMSTAEFAKSKGWTDPVRPTANAPAPGNGGSPQGVNAQDPFANLPVFDNDRSLVPWGGGLPILSGGRIVGGIGLSGAAGPQKDEDCARVGADLVKDKAK